MTRHDVLRIALVVVLLVLTLAACYFLLAPVPPRGGVLVPWGLYAR